MADPAQEVPAEEVAAPAADAAPADGTYFFIFYESLRNYRKFDDNLT